MVTGKWKLMLEYLVEDLKGNQKYIWTTMDNKQSIYDMGYKIIQR